MTRHTLTIQCMCSPLTRLAAWQYPAKSPQEFADTHACKLTGSPRPTCTILAFFVAGVFTLLMAQASVTQADAYRYKQADGSVLFTDIKLSPGETKTTSFASLGSRKSYRGSYGRPTASASCAGVNATVLQQRYQAVAAAMETSASRHNLDPLLLRAVARVESCYDTKAVSSAGAEGILQLMPATARELSVSNSFNAAANIEGGASYLAWLLKRYDGSTKLALAAYNAGPGAVDKHKGIPPYRETMRYVPTVLAHFEEFKRSRATGTLARQ